ncbi:MAG: isoprenylcysteine carboxylmethyltransferase family protein [Candidatus Kryptoniota bacterium]
MLCLFLPARTLSWAGGWIFVLLFVGFFTSVNLWLSKHNPSLLKERLRLRTPDQKGWDRLLFPFLEFLIVGWLLFISFDATRFHWSSVSIPFQLIGALILLCSFYLFFLTFRENSYLSPVVRFQEERGQKVISTGPYRYVRHPMYSGIDLFAVGTPLLLGSWYGVLIGFLLMIVLARRAVLEERMLIKELPDYESYTIQVRYRLLPHIW